MYEIQCSFAARDWLSMCMVFFCNFIISFKFQRQFNVKLACSLHSNVCSFFVSFQFWYVNFFQALHLQWTETMTHTNSNTLSRLSVEIDHVNYMISRSVSFIFIFSILTFEELLSIPLYLHRSISNSILFNADIDQ